MQRTSMFTVSLGLLTLLVTPTPGVAAAWHPASDAEVVAQLPGGARRDTGRGEHRGIAPTDLAGALAQARDYVTRARAEGDPRYLGRALGVLQPWNAAQDAPVDLLVLRATIHQSLHQFPLALRELDAVLAREPLHAQALLTRATVLQVTGRYAEAARDCRSLERSHGGLVSTTCAMSVASLMGQGRAAYVMLDYATRSAGEGESITVRGWSRSVLGEIAERNGDLAATRAHFQAALAIDPQDRYVRAAYADLLLDQGEPAAALALTNDAWQDDNLLLRRALALSALQSPARHEAVATLRDRYAAARQRGDALHLREEARFALELQRDPARALRLAVANWAVQKEPADARILLQAAVAAGSAADEQTAQSWLRHAGIADTYAQRSLAQVSRRATRTAS